MHFSIIIFFAIEVRLLFLCGMNRIVLILILSCGFFVSCTSEYDECLTEAKQLRQRYQLVKQNNALNPNDLTLELMKIQSEIDYLAQVSGNEHKFFQDLKH